MSLDLTAGTFKFDYDVCVSVKSLRDGKEHEDPVYAHRIILSASSVFFKNLLLAAPVAPIASIGMFCR